MYFLYPPYVLLSQRPLPSRFTESIHRIPERVPEAHYVAEMFHFSVKLRSLQYSETLQTL